MNQVTPSAQIYKTYRKAILKENAEKAQEKEQGKDSSNTAKEEQVLISSKPVRLPNQRNYKIVVNSPPPIKQESNISNKSKKEVPPHVLEFPRPDVQGDLGHTRINEEELPDLVQSGSGSRQSNEKEKQEVTSRLVGLGGAFIKQRNDFTTVINGCDQNNFYDVFELKDGLPFGKALFRYMETSTCCSRACAPTDCRPMTLDAFNIRYDREDDEACIQAIRESHCSVLCFGRPKMVINWMQNEQSKLLGTISEPWSCSNHALLISDEEDKELYKINSSYCQLGLACGWFPCSSCQVVSFDITDPKSLKKVGSFLKTGKGFCVQPHDLDFNNCKIEFPHDASWQQKALLITCAVFLDMLMFEDRQPNKLSIGCSCHEGLKRLKKKKK